MTSHPNNPQQSSTNHRAENDMSPLSLINETGMPSLGDITSLKEVEVEQDNKESNHSLDNTEQEIENLLNDSALFENHPINTTELSNLNVPTLKASIDADLNPKATPKSSLNHQNENSHIPTLNTEVNNRPSLASSSIPATTDSHKTDDRLNLDGNVDNTINEQTLEMETLNRVINEAEQHNQRQPQQAEQAPTKQPQDTTTHISDDSHTSISTEQTQTRLPIEETTVEQLASQIDQQLDDILSAPTEAPIETESEIQTVPAFNDSNFTHTDNPHNTDKPPTQPSTTTQPHPPLNSASPAKAALSPHDELHKQLSKKMDQFIVEAAATLTDELNRQLSTRLENIILNSIDTILPSLLEQIGQSLRQEVKNNVKQQLPTLINEAMGQTTQVR